LTSGPVLRRKPLKGCFKHFKEIENKQLTPVSLHQSSVSLMFFFSGAILRRDFEILLCVETFAQESTSCRRSKILDDVSNHKLY